MVQWLLIFAVRISEAIDSSNFSKLISNHPHITIEFTLIIEHLSIQMNNVENVDRLIRASHNHIRRMVIQMAK